MPRFLFYKDFYDFFRFTRPSPIVNGFPSFAMDLRVANWRPTYLPQIILHFTIYHILTTEVHIYYPAHIMSILLPWYRLSDCWSFRSGSRFTWRLTASCLLASLTPSASSSSTSSTKGSWLDSTCQPTETNRAEKGTQHLSQMQKLLL